MTSCLAAQTDGQCLHHDRAYPEKQNNNFGQMLPCNNWLTKRLLAPYDISKLAPTLWLVNLMGSAVEYSF